MQEYLKLKGGMNTGTVTHMDLKQKKGKDYGLRFIVKVDDNSFMVVKFAPVVPKTKNYLVKSVKYWSLMDMDVYLEHNTPIDEVPDDATYLTLSLMLRHLQLKYPKIYETLHANAEIMFSSINITDVPIKYHSYYESKGETEEDLVFRLAFNTSTPLNMVMKVWWTNDYSWFSDEWTTSHKQLSIKFDYTDIGIMAAEWNTGQDELSEHGLDKLIEVSEDIEVTNIPESRLHTSKVNKKDDKEEEQKEETNSSKQTTGSSGIQASRSGTSKIFNFSKVNTEYYIIGERAVIVFQVKTRKSYCYWDLLGKEDHRLIVSAKGPFDNNLEVQEGKPWKLFQLSEEDFLSSVKMTSKEINVLWSKYSMGWFLNVQDLLVYRV